MEINNCPRDKYQGDHEWEMFYPRRDFHYRQCVKCDRKQLYVDGKEWYDLETKSYIDKYGVYPIKEFDGYED